MRNNRCDEFKAASACPAVHMYVFLYYVHMYIHMCETTEENQTIIQGNDMYIYLSICLPAYLPLPAYTCLFACLPTCPPTYRSTDLSIYLSIYLPTYLPTYLPSYLPTYLCRS